MRHGDTALYTLRSSWREGGKKSGTLYFCRENIYIEMKIYQSLRIAEELILQSAGDSHLRVAGGLLSTEEVKAKSETIGSHSGFKHGH